MVERQKPTCFEYDGIMVLQPLKKGSIVLLTISISPRLRVSAWTGRRKKFEKLLRGGILTSFFIKYLVVLPFSVTIAWYAPNVKMKNPVFQRRAGWAGCQSLGPGKKRFPVLSWISSASRSIRPGVLCVPCILKIFPAPAGRRTALGASGNTVWKRHVGKRKICISKFWLMHQIFSCSSWSCNKDGLCSSWIQKNKKFQRVDTTCVTKP